MSWIDLLALTALGHMDHHPLSLAYEVRDLDAEVRALSAAVPSTSKENADA